MPAERTPGPWHLGMHGEAAFIANGTAPKRDGHFADAKKPRDYLAKIMLRGPHLTPDIAAANGQAMAATPDLIAALTDAIEALEMIDDDTPEAQAIIKQGRAALTKAGVA